MSDWNVYLRVEGRDGEAHWCRDGSPTAICGELVKDHERKTAEQLPGTCMTCQEEHRAILVQAAI